MSDRKVHRCRNEALRSRLKVKRRHTGEVTVVDRHRWANGNAREMPPTVWFEGEDSGGVIVVAGHDNTVVGCDMKEAQHVTLAECRDQQFFGIPARSIAVKNPSTRALDRWLSIGADHGVAAIRSVAGSSHTTVASPVRCHRKVVFLMHGIPPVVED